ncbi:MAG: hypothetical protein JOS17DRAFT_826430 [Linnemannia elongata]|nr:MAG: hypothetical protein JOS17DRAFT_826430 [Linnemannia elongata]
MSISHSSNSATHPSIDSSKSDTNENMPLTTNPAPTIPVLNSNKSPSTNSGNSPDISHGNCSPGCNSNGSLVFNDAGSPILNSDGQRIFNSGRLVIASINSLPVVSSGSPLVLSKSPEQSPIVVTPPTDSQPLSGLTDRIFSLARVIDSEGEAYALKVPHTYAMDVFSLYMMFLGSQPRFTTLDHTFPDRLDDILLENEASKDPNKRLILDAQALLRNLLSFHPPERPKSSRITCQTFFLMGHCPIKLSEDAFYTPYTLTSENKKKDAPDREEGEVRAVQKVKYEYDDLEDPTSTLTSENIPSSNKNFSQSRTYTHSHCSFSEWDMGSR